MDNFKERMEDWYDDLDTDPDKKKVLVILGILGAVIVIGVFIFLGFALSKSAKGSEVRAAQLVSGDELGDERNDAGGLIADINWDEIIGHDRDGNPIYGTNGLDASVGGYDMCGAPILKDDMVVIGTGEDGLPIYDYSARDEARRRGLRNGLNKDIDWNTVVGYDKDGNPIFGTFGADPNILGYDMLGNPIYKGSVRVSARTDSGLPIYDYSTIEVARVFGKQQQADLRNGKRTSRTTVIASADDVVKTSYGTDGTDGQGIDGSDGQDGSNRYGNNGMVAPDGKDGKSGNSGSNGNDGSDATARNGSRGKNGMTGADGKDGRDGKKGPRGDKGPAGVNGTNGISGTSGKSGTSGVAGQDGKGGSRGADGKSGKAGTDGKDGSYGSRGDDGYNGMSGSDGKDGRKGTDGRDNYSAGKDGRDGKDGTDGKSGKKGTSGTRGERGDTGFSMYLHVRYSLGSPIGKLKGQVPLYTEEQMRSMTTANNNSGDYNKANPEYEWWVGTYSDYEENVCSDDPEDYEWMMLTDMTVHPTTENNVDKLIVTDMYD